MTRDVARRLLLGTAPALLGAAVAGGPTSACYSAGAGTSPPPKSFYFPVGLAVSKGGNVLYAVNSDFDLQWNGGTLQSYDLFGMRRDATALIIANLTGTWPTTDQQPFIGISKWAKNCRDQARGTLGNGTRALLGQSCAPPVNSAVYEKNSAIIGAFATDLQLSLSGTRLFMPVRGDATLTWADVPYDPPNATGPADFRLYCGQGADGRCDAIHHSGSDPNESGNTRHVTMPGEPFGIAQTEDGSAVAITHQTDTKTSLLMTVIHDSKPGTAPSVDPSMQFVLDGLPIGGSGIAAVPHDRDAVPPPCETNGNMPPCVRPAFLETSRNPNSPELDLLRYYNDDGSNLHRPFLAKEAVYGFTTNAPGTDSRGIAIDPTPRMACKWRATQFLATPPYLVPPSAADATACGELPARVFFANRTPPSLVVGEIGKASVSGDARYDPDLLRISGNISLPVGPSRVYLAPIVTSAGNYALRVFIVCFDASAIVVYDPEPPGRVENTIYVGQGPFAMAFDPFSTQDVAQNAPVQLDTRQDAQLNLRRYRFAYVASFTGSFVQLIDLDQSSPETFESIVFTLGQATKPKGT